MNLEFDNNDPIIKDLSDELEKLEKKIEKDIEIVSNTAKVLKLLSESVKIASSIIVIAMSL